jgi:O-antigen/teichoic acid export membrane protein
LAHAVSGILAGACVYRKKAAPVISSIIELLMKIIAALWVIPSFGFVGICATEPVTWVIMTVFLITVYMVKTRKNPEG